MEFEGTAVEALAKRIGRFCDHRVPPTTILHPLMALAGTDPTSLVAHYGEGSPATWHILATSGARLVSVSGSADARGGWTLARENELEVDDNSIEITAWSAPISEVRRILIRDSESRSDWGVGRALENATFTWSVVVGDEVIDWPGGRSGNPDEFFGQLNDSI